MNYYDTRQRSDERWDFTRMNDGHIWPVGYCTPTTPCDCWLNAYREGRLLVPGGEPDCKVCGGTRRVGNPDYCGSHDTEQEARECFARYLLDGWREESYANWTGCEWVQRLGEPRCDRPTKKGLTTRPPLGTGHALCDAHRTFNHLVDLAPVSAGQIISSY